ncbi:hypothetical protein ACIBCN_02600 [Nocardia sp. NPDC051052]|uniref:hypothetical protein n=1 Tax=Nocardia sp. NPDC051052 TaxID=3364322 RepID=UPI0037954D62
MLRRAGTLASATALAAVACAGVAAAAPTTTPATPPTVNNVDITAAELSGSGLAVSVSYTCESTDKTVTLQVFVRSTGEGAEQTIGAKTKATCNAERQTVSVTATKIAESEPFTPAAGEMVRVFGSLVSGDSQQSIEGGTAVKRLTVK